MQLPGAKKPSTAFAIEGFLKSMVVSALLQLIGHVLHHVQEVGFDVSFHFCFVGIVIFPEEEVFAPFGIVLYLYIVRQYAVLDEVCTFCQVIDCEHHPDLWEFIVPKGDVHIKRALQRDPAAGLF